MREILFRGKRIDNGERVEGYLRFGPDMKDAYIGCFVDYIDEGLHTDYLEFRVFSATIGQSTGLTDKNGKRIFEGDILRQKKNGVYGLPFSVVFDDGGFMWNENGRRDFLYQSICDTCEVIGNIHDNQELIGGLDD